MVTERRLVIVDDHPLFREGIKALINASPHFEVAAEAGTAEQGLRLMLKLKPDMAVLDVSLPDKSGIQLARDVLEKLPALRILFLSMHSRVGIAAQAFKAGAKGFLVKDSASEVLLSALDAVARGKEFLDQSISRDKVEHHMLNLATQRASLDKVYDTLTLREQEIFRSVAQGKTSRMVAEELHISIRTVENHRQNIMRKLGVRNTADMVRFAGEIGLI